MMQDDVYMSYAALSECSQEAASPSDVHYADVMSDDEGE